MKAWMLRLGAMVLTLTLMPFSTTRAEEPTHGDNGFTVEVQESTPSSDARAAAVLGDTGLHVEVIRPRVQPNGKRILIYHTHTWEAFQQVQDAPYIETEKWRTKDNTANMVAVGDALAAALTALGFTVEHDTTAFEPPDLSTSYTRSLRMLETRRDRGEAYDLYIDLHRDAYASANAIKKTVIIGGEATARFMVLIGKGENYSEKPNWKANYAYAQLITENLNRQCDGLGRDVKLKTGRFNQHIAPCCVLIECGSNYNTLDEVLRGIPYLASAIEAALLNTEND